MSTEAQKKAYRRYNKKRTGKVVAVRLTESQQRWLSKQRNPNEGESSALKRLAGAPEDKEQ